MATLPSWTPPKSKKSPKVYEVTGDKVVTRDASAEEAAKINAEEEARIVARRNAEAKEAPASVAATASTSPSARNSVSDEGTATLDAPEAPAPKKRGRPAKAKPAATPAPAKPAKEKGGKAKAAPATNGEAKKPGRPKGEFSWTEKRVAIIKALRSMKATSEEGAETAEKIAVKAGLATQDVKHYCYKDMDLVKNGFVAIAKGGEQGRLLGYYLTEKGSKADLKAS